jgi:hypothetical protein
MAAACLTAAVFVPPAASAGGKFTVGRGQVVGPQTVTSPGVSSVTNNGTINGGGSAGLTVTSPSVRTITNNGTITSSKTGISASGSSSQTIVNTGTIVVKGSSKATGISSGP